MDAGMSEPAAFEDQSLADQIGGLIWVLGFVSYALLRTYRAPIRFRIAFQRTALHELNEVMKIEIVRTDPTIYRLLYQARVDTLSIYPDARPQFARAAVDTVSRAIDLLKDRRAECLQVSS